MSTDNLDQTSFSQTSPAPLEVAQPEFTVVKKRSLVLPLTIGATIVLIGGIFVLVLLTRRGSGTKVNNMPTPLPSQAPIQTDQIRKDIEPDLQKIEQSNPEGDEHPFPPVDFTTRIKDPNSK